MNERHKLTLADVQAERERLERGEVADLGAMWDEAVERFRALPDLQRIRTELGRETGPVERHWSPERDVVHEAVVALINDHGEVDSSSASRMKREGGHGE